MAALEGLRTSTCIVPHVQVARTMLRPTFSQKDETADSSESRVVVILPAVVEITRPFDG